MVDVDEKRKLQRLAEAREEGIEGLRLGVVARKAVQYEAIFRIGLAQPVLDHSEHDLIAHELPVVHRRLGPLAKLGPRGDRRPKKVACGDLGNLVLFDQQF